VKPDHYNLRIKARRAYGLRFGTGAVAPLAAAPGSIEKVAVDSRFYGKNRYDTGFFAG
jgi:hypothetical protein